MHRSHLIYNYSDVMLLMVSWLLYYIVLHMWCFVSHINSLFCFWFTWIFPFKETRRKNFSCSLIFFWSNPFKIYSFWSSWLLRPGDDFQPHQGLCRLISFVVTFNCCSCYSQDFKFQYRYWFQSLAKVIQYQISISIKKILTRLCQVS